jgi:hypothetical protein
MMEGMNPAIVEIVVIMIGLKSDRQARDMIT